MHVARPEIVRPIEEEDLQCNLDYFERTVDSLSKGVRGMFYSTGNMHGKILEFIAIDPRVEQSRTWELWLTSMQYHYAFYRVSLAEGGTLEQIVLSVARHGTWVALHLARESMPVHGSALCTRC